MPILDNYSNFWKQLASVKLLSKFGAPLQTLTRQKLENPIQGDYPRWQLALDQLPEINVKEISFSSNAISCFDKVEESIQQQAKKSYQGLIPWRKGPFDMFGLYLDSEWQSYMKWNRIQDQLPDLKDKIVLDVGCGNGYYMFRMMPFEPKLILGIDPGLLQLMQFWSIEKYVQSNNAAVLPIGIQDMPRKMECFDVAFSMGVLYHRKSPIDHIIQLANKLVKGGSLVLETLIVDGDEKACLLPYGRYAQMRNVWFLPSVAMLQIMLERNGFKDIQCIDVSQTTVEEQRSTEWMKFHSLSEFLNPEKTKTIEGYDLPKRATLVAVKK